MAKFKQYNLGEIWVAAIKLSGSRNIQQQSKSSNI